MITWQKRQRKISDRCCFGVNVISIKKPQRSRQFFQKHDLSYLLFFSYHVVDIGIQQKQLEQLVQKEVEENTQDKIQKTRHA